ncbi:hypothetical protein HYQ46_003173 [Verticillium longisporum]|nr:hypothetical protein HYQ46_003173 [Verticillium longisporum]
MLSLSVLSAIVAPVLTPTFGRRRFSLPPLPSLVTTLHLLRTVHEVVVVTVPGIVLITVLPPLLKLVDASPATARRVLLALLST